jgi:hypothetical protein
MTRHVDNVITEYLRRLFIEYDPRVRSGRPIAPSISEALSLPRVSKKQNSQSVLSFAGGDRHQEVEGFALPLRSGVLFL